MMKLPLLAMLTLSTFGCGTNKAKFTDKRSGEQPEVAADTQLKPLPVPGPITEMPPAPSANPPAETAPASSTDVDGEPLVTDGTVVKGVYDEKIDHSIKSLYYQSSPGLKDLFVDPENSATSMLCWPSALAYQAEAMRTRAAAPLSKLVDPSAAPLTGAEAAHADIRHFATRCRVDLKAGTTVPQGVSCIDEYLKASGYKPEMAVVGLDAQWGVFGMFPTGTKSERRTATPDDVRAATRNGRGIIALVGFYAFDTTKARFERVKGHFVSMTGFGHRDVWGSDELTLEIVNPGTDYAPNPVGRNSERVKMKRFSPDPGVVMPENVAFSLQGPGFDTAPYTSFVESLIIFDGTTP